MRAFCPIAFGIAAVLSWTPLATAQEKTAAQTSYQTASLSSTQVRTIRSGILSRDFQISVSLPWSYGSIEKRYPTLYLTDADGGFGLAHVACRQAESDQEIPEVIVVGIGYGLDMSRDLSTWASRRTQELTPTAAKDYPGSGDADRFSRFVREELIPFIDANYRTDPTDRTLTGGSLGGLFALYVMLQTPESFQQYIARSPSLFFDDRVLFRVERDYAAARHDLPVTLFSSMGTSESDRMLTAWRDFTRVLEARQYEGFRMKTTSVDANHNVATGMGLYPGLKAVLGGITLDEDVLQRYVGRYKLPQGVVLTVTRESRQLWANWGGERLKLLARSPVKFSFAGRQDLRSDARGVERLEFQVDAQAGVHVAHIVVYQNGRSISGTRVEE